MKSVSSVSNFAHVSVETSLSFSNSRCNGGYSKAALDPNKCLESNSNTFELATGEVPEKMTYKCGKYGLSGGGGICAKNTYVRHYRGKEGCGFLCWRCPGGYEDWGVGCMKRCDHGYDTVATNCVRWSCPSGTSDYLAACKINFLRNRYEQASNCNGYTAATGTSVYKNWAGECWQSCKSNENLIAGICTPKMEKKLSINIIVAELNKIKNSIPAADIRKFSISSLIRRETPLPSQL